MKRFFDVVVSFLALVILSPLLVPLSILLLLTGEHYIFYTHKRKPPANCILHT